MTGPAQVIRRSVPWRYTGPLGPVLIGIAEMDEDTQTSELVIFGPGETQRPRVAAGDEVTIAGTVFHVDDVVVGDRGTVGLTPLRVEQAP